MARACALLRRPRAGRTPLLLQATGKRFLCTFEGQFAQELQPDTGRMSHPDLTPIRPASGNLNVAGF
ncbi:hypothetical protein chiPu_0013046 [Chiloscyllium punctatum]|uniref:Uncharacterized protein n=1 Tax=Chiloscyllium punctatum TaxID=137246 RepID=A0A401SW09_CHIPU|nr:hypothetical protein [Chiloscyllium punctatum]